jgi:hypothetical protein
MRAHNCGIQQKGDEQQACLHWIGRILAHPRWFFPGRKILAASKLHEMGVKPCPVRERAISDAICNAHLIPKGIDERWPSRKE